jgi:hypothetical protein
MYLSERHREPTYQPMIHWFSLHSDLNHTDAMGRVAWKLHGSSDVEILHDKNPALHRKKALNRRQTIRKMPSQTLPQ